MGCARFNIEWSKTDASVELTTSPKGKILTTLKKFVFSIECMLLNPSITLKAIIGNAPAYIILTQCCISFIRRIVLTRTAPGSINIGFVCDTGLGSIYVLQDTDAIPILTIDGGYIFLRES